MQSVDPVLPSTTDDRCGGREPKQAEEETQSKASEQIAEKGGLEWLRGGAGCWRRDFCALFH